MSTLFARPQGYQLLQEENAEPPDKKHKLVSGNSLRIWWLAVAVLVLGSAVAGFFSGLLFQRDVLTGMSVSHETKLQATFEYHRDFSDPPSEASNALWLSLFPQAHGFVRPPNTSGLSIISVFHQLHCINVLRHGYYVALNGSYLSESLQDISISRESIKHEHVVHCFDYLRQAVQCFSDRTIEEVDLDRGGATGWGSTHACNDHGKTFDLARDWELKEAHVD